AWRRARSRRRNARWLRRCPKPRGHRCRRAHAANWLPPRADLAPSRVPATVAQRLTLLRYDRWPGTRRQARPGRSRAASGAAWTRLAEGRLAQGPWLRRFARPGDTPRPGAG